MINLLKKLKINSNVLSLEQDLSLNRDCSLFGFNFGEKTWLVNSLKKPVLYITTSGELAGRLYSQFASMGLKAKEAMFLPLDCNFNLYSKNEASENLILALSEIQNNNLDVLIASPEILLKKLPLKDNKNSGLRIKVGDSLSIKSLTEKLALFGYTRQEEIETKGNFTVKGDSLSVLDYDNGVIYKIEFFDDEIEKIKVLSKDDYSTLNTENEINILPNNLFDSSNFDEILERIDKELLIEKKKQSNENYAKLVSLKDQIALKLTLNDTSGIENILAPFLSDYSKITDYFTNGIVVFDETKQIVDYTKNLYTKHRENVKNYNARGEQFLINLNAFVEEKEVYKSLVQKLSFGSITTQNNIFSPQAVYSFQSGATTRYLGNTDLLIQNLKHYDNSYYTTIICAQNDNKATTLYETLKNVGMASRVCPLNKIEKEQINIVPFGIDYGFCLPKEKIIVIGAKELARKEQQKQSNKKKDVFFELPKSGDFVVHEKYGIGKCLGIEKLKFRGYNKDVIVLEYAKGDKVFLPTENIDLISKYVGEGKAPKLNAIGSTEFIKTKQKVKESCKKLAVNLMEIYSDRHKAMGFKYEIDDSLYKTFEESFPYEETEDQLQAVEDCFSDMKQGRLMDRLVCGDVGFGKTEVAIRVIFATVMAGKQVAFLAPTTILSEQHYNSCFARLSSFGVKVAALNRFKTKKQVDSILNDLKEGKIDVVCGTHRLLSKDVEFKNLGLLVLDEEQRFGVGDKEKIKNIKRDINVLSLSATPIPRTLHMGLTGIRDISVIATAPKVRQPIQTFVMEESEGVIKEAIERELTREGQVLIIYNRVETIYEVYKKIKDIVGEEVNVGVAHGQMTAKALEDEIMRLYSGETKVLIATSLIENGVDLPNANTLIVLNADNFGLSQLYQFRGRVGRGNALAYAYLLYAPQKVLNETAYKRLNTLMEFTELGSGFKIATRDLEIRGAGNILGAEQHGHMAQIGYDMYCKLLNEAVEEMKGKASLQKQKEIKMDISLDSFIPESFILSTDARIRIYNQLISITSEEDRLEKLEQIEALYGKVPQEVINLSLVTLLRSYCVNYDAFSVKVGKELVCLSFKKEDREKAVLLLNKLDKIKVKYNLSGSINIDVILNLNEQTVVEKINKLINILS